MNKILAELVRISNVVGGDETFVQGGGGNTSAKTPDGKSMYIKASGTALKDMNKSEGWRKVNIDHVLSILKDDSLAKLDTYTRETEVVNKLLLGCIDNLTITARPSVEAHLHAILDPYVIHLHPSAVGAYVNAKNGKAELQKLFKDDKLPFLWVPYIDPGFMLAKKIARLVKDYQLQFRTKPQIIFLEKHGLFVSANTANTALSLARRTIARCDSKLKHPKAANVKPVPTQLIEDTALCIRKALFDTTGEYGAVTYFNNDTIASFMRDKNAGQMLAKGVLTPDELIYSNGSAMWVEKCDAEKISAKIRSLIQRGQKTPIAFIVKGVGLFAVGKKKIAPTMRDIVTSSLFIRTNALKMGGINCLNKRQQDFIDKWESEAFRKALATGLSKGDLEDRIALVTGAGSGLGRSIAIGLARAGAMVALADIDLKAAEQTKEIIQSELTDSYAVAIPCNVTDELGVDKAFAGLLKNFGGLDILVNAAGVAPAAALEDLSLAKWRFALELNLTGYFLMAKAAVKIMKKQQIGGNIVNISSKSGIQPSKNNSPYNATKAGQLHMTRGWAMELGDHNIRVNAVCPGNVFEGSKIWNPQYIKTNAKKYGIKPEQVIPYYINKTMLKKEILGQDIADAVVFLACDKARMITAQTLVVDAGQAMVR